MHTGLKIMLPAILQGQPTLLLRIFLQCALISLSLTAPQGAVAADAARDTQKTSNIASSVEDNFMLGQQYLEQSNLAQAQLTLTRLPAASPYAKLLAGNIAAQSGDYERAYLLLLPLQSNLTLIKPAAASLHASLSDIYAKQGDTASALEQLILREAFLPANAIEAQHERIWNLLTKLELQDLIALRGESNNTTTQGWVDLCLANKNQDVASGINTWASSYPDHAASEFAKTLLAKTATQSASQSAATLPTNDAIALILPQTTVNISDQGNAFYLGVKTALTQAGLQNPLRVYTSTGSPESISEQYNIAKNEGALYFMNPALATSFNAACNSEQAAISWLDPNSGKGSALHSADLSWADETRTIIRYALNNAMQHITLVGSDDELSQQLLASLQSAWKEAQGNEANVISLPVASAESNLLDFKAKISGQLHDMIILAVSASEARAIRPYLDISTPVFAYSRVHEDNPAKLNAIRFVEIPFLLNASGVKPSDVDLRQADTPPASQEEYRLFALGYDYLQLLLASAKSEPHTLMINGLTGKLSINPVDGCITRQPAIARFSYDDVLIEQ